MNAFEQFINNTLVKRIFWSIIIVLISVLIYHLVSKFLAAKEKRNSRIFSQKKNRTYLRMFRSIVAYALFILTVLVILQIFGVNVSSMLAGLGIASVIIGFALQDAMKDIIRGLEIISDSYYDIGDFIKYGDNTGQVLSIGLRTTKIQDMNSMNIVSIANRNIDQVEVVSEYIYLPIRLPVALKLDVAEGIVHEIVKAVLKDKTITTAAYQGVNNLAGAYTEYQIVITCDPANLLSARRSALRTIAATLEAHKLAIPRDQVDIFPKAAASRAK